MPRTGVIYVMQRAAEHGYAPGRDGWANLGQGAPEAGPLPGAPPRLRRIELTPSQHEYAPVGGLLALRQAVADFYNAAFRRGRTSQYTAANVSIAAGGRSAITRLAASLGEINMGHFIPDYTAYEELLGTFRSFISIPILVDGSTGYRIAPSRLREEIVGRGLGAVLLSNPCNPTGQVIEGQDLQEWIDVGRDCDCTLVFDEFYSHFIYTGPEDEARFISAARHVENVNSDPVIMVDGITKNWRYPGWRISWTVGPEDIIEQVTSAGSFLDGGANCPFQRETIPLLELAHVDQETCAIQGEFRRKRAYMLERLRTLGIEVETEPHGAFYVWGNLGRLPSPLNDGIRFFEAGLREQVITVPGVFFDVNPGKRRPHAKYETYARFSFGPEASQLQRGLDAIERVVARYT